MRRSSSDASAEPELRILPQVAPKKLEFISVSVSTALLPIPKSNKSIVGVGKEETCPVLLFVFDKETNEPLWKVKKDYTALTSLESKTRPDVSQYHVPRMPQRQLFTSQSPVKLDARRSMLDDYFKGLMQVPLFPPETAGFISNFLSTDIVTGRDGAVGADSRKESYLSKRGRNFGGWKVRYFVLSMENGPFLNYYDRPNGQFGGNISLFNATVTAKVLQTPADDGHPENEHRHAFVIMEAKKSSQYVSHILCAETDEDRDEWVEAIKEFVEVPAYCEISDKNGAKNENRVSKKVPPRSVTVLENNGVPSSSAPTSPQSPKKKNSQYTSRQKSRHSRGQSMDRKREKELESDDQKPNSPGTGGKVLFRGSKKDFSGPLNDVLKGQVSTENINHDSIQKAMNYLMNDDSTNSDNTDSSESGALFGAPLKAALALSSKQIKTHVVPSLVARIIELLKSKNAVYEEGVFRRNGSSVAAKNLRHRFNVEYDVDLIKAQTDIHSATSLLKQYLRNLPCEVISGEKLEPFTSHRHELSSDEQKKAIRRVMMSLERPEYDLLAVLFHYLVKVVRHSKFNKMNTKNLAIVFQATLSIPQEFIETVLSDYDVIFN